MSQLQGVIAAWGSSYNVTRRTKGALGSNGVYSAGTQTTVAITASIQPVSGDELKSLPEGQHLQSVRVVYTTTELKASSSTHDPDRFTLDGDTYEVFKLEKHSAWGGTHYRAYIARMETSS